MHRIDLNGAWTLQFGPQVERPPDDRMMAPEIPDDWDRIPAGVPGNVELDLIRAGLLPEDLERGAILPIAGSGDPTVVVSRARSRRRMPSLPLPAIWSWKGWIPWPRYGSMDR